MTSSWLNRARPRTSARASALALTLAAITAACGGSGPAPSAPARGITPLAATPTPAGPDAVTPDAALVDRPRSKQQEEQLRERLDTTLWEPEVAAQRHEEAFIALWDRLRAAAEPHEVLASFPFGQLRLGALSEPVALEDGLLRRRTSGDGARLDGAGWRAWIDARVAEGWRLVQTEWHHSKFIPGAPARSEVSVVLHARNGDRRVAITGTVHVAWRPEAGPSGHIEPAELDARALELVERAGPDAFAPALELDPEPQIHVAARHVQPVLVHDLDGDGRAEVLLVGANRLYRNRSAKGAIKLVEEELLPKDVYYSMPGAPFAAVLADVDGDGVVDLVTAHVAGDINLFSGTSKGGFSTEPRVAARMPVPLDTPVALTAGDIDSDGDLDLFVGQYKRPYVHGQMPTPYYDANDGDPAYLLRNDGRGAFTDITDEAGLAAKRRRRTWSASLLDLDDDRKLDLIVVSDFSGLDLYKGDGAGHFTDVTAELVDERASFGMSHTIGDYNLDGFLDLYVVGMSSTTARRLEQLGLGREGHEDIQEMRMKMAYGNRLYDGDARHRLRAGAFAQDVARTGWSWGSTSFDFDRDGDLDIYVVNGHISRETAKDYCTTYWRHDVYTGTSERDAELERFFLDEFQTAISEGVSWNGFEHNKLFVTDPARGFVEAGFPLDVALEDDARATVSEDLDLDGRPDLLVVLAKARAGKVRGESTDERLAVLQNQWSSPNKWVGVRLGGARSPIGARVTVEVEGAPTQQHRVVTGDSLQSQHAPHKLFGLGPEARVNAIAVEWADGTTTRLERPALGRYHVMR